MPYKQSCGNPSLLIGGPGAEGNHLVSSGLMLLVGPGTYFLPGSCCSATHTMSMVFMLMHVFVIMFSASISQATLQHCHIVPLSLTPLIVAALVLHVSQCSLILVVPFLLFQNNCCYHKHSSSCGTLPCWTPK